MKARITQIRVAWLCLVVLGSWLSAFGKDGSSPSLYGPGPERWVFSQEALGFDQSMVRTKGYDVNSIESLSDAATDREPVIRAGALHLLARKARRQALPVLQKGLDDPWPSVRCAAARLMGVLGDQSGLDRMRKDWVDLTREGQKNDTSEQDRRERMNWSFAKWTLGLLWEGKMTKRFFLPNL
jgi:hypothetical protein